MAAETAAPSERFHHVAARFGNVGTNGLYDRARPAYPTELVDQIISSVDKDDLEILDFGAGTGILTRMLITYPRVASITAVEPVEGMRQDWERNMDKAAAGSKIKLSVIDGTFQDAPLPSACADIIVCGQAFHWAHFGGYEGAMAEFARLLRPGGTVAWIWNLEDKTTPAKWVGQIRTAYEMHEAATPQYHRGLWRAALETTARKTYFEPNETELHVKRKIPTSEQGVVDRVLSKSYIDVLDQAQRAEVEAQMREILRRGDGIEWIDREAGSFQYPYGTDLWMFKRNETEFTPRPPRGA